MIRLYGLEESAKKKTRLVPPIAATPIDHPNEIAAFARLLARQAAKEYIKDNPSCLEHK